MKDATGKMFATNEHEQAEVELEPGDYTINIKDSIAGDAAHFKGGFSYELSVKRTALKDETPAVASAAPVDSSTTTTAATVAAPGKPTVKAAGAIVKPVSAPAAKPGATAAKPAAPATSAKPAASGAPAAPAKK